MKKMRDETGILLKIVKALGWFSAGAFLIVIYFLVITPIAVVLKILGKDPLDRKIDKNASTYWIKRPLTTVTKEQLEKQF